MIGGVFQLSRTEEKKEMNAVFITEAPLSTDRVNSHYEKGEKAYRPNYK